jgi:hypothetical protein
VIARTFEADLSAPVVAAGTRIQNVRQISERVAMGRALWRELVVGFASQLGELNLGFTQLAALYVLAEGRTYRRGRRRLPTGALQTNMCHNLACHGVSSANFFRLRLSDAALAAAAIIYTCSTCQYSSSTAVGRPKMVSSTRT